MKSPLAFMLLCVLAWATLNAQGQRQVDVPPFNTVVLQSSIELVIQQERYPSVRIEARNGGDADRVRAEVRDGVLHISLRSGRDRWWKGINDDLVVTVGAPSLDKIVLQGSGKINSYTPLTYGDVAIIIQGSGDMDLKDLDAESLSVLIQGSGDIHLVGRTGDASYEVQGSGDISALEMRSATAQVNIQGSGDVSCYPTQRLTGSITGSGDLTFGGRPTEVSVRKQGSGDLRKVQ